MKKLILFNIIAMFSYVASAQETNYKFGKVSKEEVEMKVYQPDSSASAVILKMDGYTSFNVINNNVYMSTEEEYRVKILKDDGVEYANITIPYYYKQNSYQEDITSIEAIAYNMEDGKIVAKKMPKKYIFKELVSENNYIKKFSIPNIKKGTVIEYRFTRTFNSAMNLDPWIIQQSIPVTYSRYETHIPNYFIFRHEAKGYEPIDRKISEKTAKNIDGNNLSEMMKFENIVFTAHNIPAIKSESFLWSISNYRSAIEFELEGIALPGELYEKLTTSWADVRKILDSHSEFGKKLNMRNPLKEETEQLSLDSLTIYKKSVALFSLLKQNIKWNNEFVLLCENIQETIKQGTGSNADINFIYMSMLKDAGIESTPILLRRRSYGILPITHPSLKKINTFIVMIKGEDGERYFMDGSSDYGYINLISPELMVEKAIIYDAPENLQEIDLSKVGNNIQKRQNLVKILADGSVKGSRLTSHSGQFASSLKEDYANSKDELDFIQEIEEYSDITVEDFSIEGEKTIGNRILEKIKFSKDITTSGDNIYVNSLLFKDERTNYFTNTERKFPVEFPYSQSVIISNTFEIPDDYIIEELPKSQKVVMPDNKLSILFLVKTQGKIIQINYKFLVKDCLITPQEYPNLKLFWEKLLAINNEQIILKRVE